MIIMSIEIDNLFAFNDFKLNFSYPKKIVHSTIDGEFLKTKTNFRYKKVNIIMGANASGKTSLGRCMMIVFNFLKTGSLDICTYMNDDKRNAKIVLDFLVDEDYLYRVECSICAKFKGDTVEEPCINSVVYRATIAKRDSYEKCLLKLKEIEKIDFVFFDRLESLPNFGYYFALTDGKDAVQFTHLDERILELVLKALDSDILAVKSLKDVEDSFVIEKINDKIIIQEGAVVKENKLSSGTKSGIAIASLISHIKKNINGFYYCDEKFSYIHSELEKTLLSIMISSLGNLEQLFFTSHNMELLDMDLPIHSFTFLKKSSTIEAIYPSDYIKKNDVSLANAVQNDIFNSMPNTDILFELEDIVYE